MPSATLPASYAFEDVFIRYSKLALTHIGDRPVAISGLTKRLERFYNSKITYGIVHRYLHKSLLWQRSGERGMNGIYHIDTMVIPSWSWLAVQGEIRYNISHLRGVSWNRDIEVVLDPHTTHHKRYVLQAPLRLLRDSCIEHSQETNFQLRGGNQNLVGWMRFDQDNETDIARLGCIAVGEQKYAHHHDWALFGEDVNAWKQYAEVKLCSSLDHSSYHYVLLVKRVLNGTEFSKEQYCRLGVGVILDAWLTKPQQTVWII